MTLNINVTIKLDPSQEILDAIKQQGDRIIMALTKAEQDIIDRFNAATTVLADEINKLIAGGTDNPDFLTALGGIAGKLETMGTPAQPVPPTV